MIKIKEVVYKQDIREYDGGFTENIVSCYLAAIVDTKGGEKELLFRYDNKEDMKDDISNKQVSKGYVAYIYEN